MESYYRRFRNDCGEERAARNKVHQTHLSCLNSFTSHSRYRSCGFWSVYAQELFGYLLPLVSGKSSSYVVFIADIILSHPTEKHRAYLFPSPSDPSSFATSQYYSSSLITDTGERLLETEDRILRSFPSTIGKLLHLTTVFNSLRIRVFKCRK